jgi:class 3 adenylate cyclase
VAIVRKRLTEPDEFRRFPNGSGSLVRVGPLEIGRAELEPGWRWSVDIKPRVGTEWCEVNHLHVLLRGRFAARMRDGEEATFEPDDVFELPAGHDAWVVGDERAVILDVSGNVADFALPTSRERILTTILMTDIVDSTPTAERVGDAVWKQRLAAHNRAVRAQLERFRGHEVDTTGDGFLATFQSPVAAVRAAAAISEACAVIGLPVRIGVHTGEIEASTEGVVGVAVHATARIMAVGGASEVIVSSVTRGLAEGAGLGFEPLGARTLKGIEAPMELHRLVRAVPGSAGP